MNTIRDYFRRLTTSQTSRFLSIVVAALAAIVVVRGCQQPKLAVEVSYLLQRETGGERIREVDDRKLPAPRPQPASKPNATTPVLPAIRFAVSNVPAPSASLVLPGRRLIPCKLVNTVDSSSLDTPIIALVTRDVFWQQRLLLPKGTEVHGRAQAHHLRDRIGSQGAWVLLWADGGEVSINGLALDMDQKDDQWGLTDGSAGLLGSRERSGITEEVKLFAAISGLFDRAVPTAAQHPVWLAGAADDEKRRALRHRCGARILCGTPPAHDRIGEHLRPSARRQDVLSLHTRSHSSALERFHHHFVPSTLATQ